MAKNKTKPWDNNWEKQQQLPGGGQGETWLVKRRGESDEQYVLKVLRRQDDPERRRRMYREVEALRRLQHPAIPRVVESNTDAYADADVLLYFVANYVEGQTLEERISQGRLRPDDAVRLIINIAETLTFCHQKGILHRDVKPDNIILRGGNINEPALIDFGQSFNREDSGQSPLTPDGQQLGNRFLHLPELQIGGSSKRDVESDISQVCGLFIYVLTGEMPVLLLDHQNLKPHERASTKPVLDEIPSASLRPLFDKGFEHVLDKRFRSFDAFKGRLYEVRDDLDHSQLTLEQSATTVTLETITPEIKTTVSSPVPQPVQDQTVKEFDSKPAQNDLFEGERGEALMLATLLGAWNEKLEGDREVIKRLVEGHD